MTESHCGRFKRGCSVVIKDLVAKPENNGRQGYIDGFSEEKHRYQIQMPAGNILHLKIENIEIASEQLAAEPAKLKEPAVPRPAASRSRSRSTTATQSQREHSAAPMCEKLNLPQTADTWIQKSGNVPRGAGVIAFRLPVGVSDIDQMDLYVCIVEKAPKWTCSKCRSQMYDSWMVCSSCKESRPHALARFIPGCSKFGPLGFPKGGRDPADQGSVLANALREWEEETGISRERLHIISGNHFDDKTVGARLLLAICSSSKGAPDAAVNAGVSWVPPEAKLECDNRHQLSANHATCGGIICSKCGVRLPAHAVLLACGECNFCFCKSCKDPDPIVMTHWMPVNKARGQLKPDRRRLLDEAIAALPSPHC